jgi:hypothetical protein
MLSGRIIVISSMIIMLSGRIIMLSGMIFFFFFFIYFFFFNIFFGGIFFSFVRYNIQHCFICRPSDSTVQTDAGTEPRTVAIGKRNDYNVKRNDNNVKRHE